MSECCVKNKKGWGSGVLYGLLPHVFCILFIVLSAIGATFATSVLKRVLLVPYFLWWALAFSLFFATLSAYIYLKRSDCCSVKSVKSKWKYLLTLYTVTIVINLSILFAVPFLANLRSPANLPTAVVSGRQIAFLQAELPCVGHAPLVIGDLRAQPGVDAVAYTVPDIFQVTFDPQKISLAEIRALAIFKFFPLINL